MFGTVNERDLILVMISNFFLRLVGVFFSFHFLGGGDVSSKIGIVPKFFLYHYLFKT